MDALLPATGRVVAISGAGRGLGAAIARRLHAEGFALACGVRDMSRRLALGERPRVSWHRYDATDPSSAAAWIEAAVAAHGRLDALVNNAGILKHFTLEEGDEAALDEMWAVNVNLRKAGVIMIGGPSPARALAGGILADSELNEG